jgi:hypothetical protein
MIRISKINKTVVKTVPKIQEDDKRPVKGADMFSEIYSNIFMVAKKKSGKTSVIYNIVENCAGRDTIVIVFCSTLHKDNNWKSIQKYCETKKIQFIGHTSLIEDGVNKLDELVDCLQEKAKQDREDETKEKPKKKCKLIMFDDDSDDEAESKPKKTKYRAPEYIIILDDLSTELKNKSVTSLLKKNRHYLSKIIISSQYLNDVEPAGRKQFDYLLVFKGQPLAKIEVIHRDCDTSIDLERFDKIYKFCTEKQYSFMYISTVDDTIRRNFDTKIDLLETKV